MPSEEDKTVVAGGDTAVPAAAASGGKKKLILFGGIGLGAIVIGLALALFVVKPMLAPSEPAPDDPTAEAAQDEHKAEKKEAKKEKSSHGEGKEGESEAAMYSIEDIVINPAGTGGSRFLSVSFGFDLESPAMIGEFKAKEPMIRDALITILSSKTVAQLTDARQKEIIRYQIKKRLTDLMKTEEIAGVYYTDFVLQ